MKAVLGTLGAIALLVAMTIFGSFYTINQTERGVLLRNGAYVETVGPGLHFKTPWIESVNEIAVTTGTVTYDRMSSYSSDQQPADIKLSYTYHIDPSRVEDVYSRFNGREGLESRLINPHVSQEFKVVFGRFSAAQAINDRARLNAEAYKTIAASLAGNPEVVLEGVQVEDIQFSGQYIESIEARMKAEIEVQRTQQNAAREKVEAEITVIKAQAAADSQLANAKAQAESTRISGDAQAAAIAAKGQALKDNPGLVALTQAERWDGHLPTTMIPGGAIPMLALGGSK